MSTESITAIVCLCTAIVGLISAIVALVIKLKAAFGDLIKDKNWKQLVPIIYNAMIEAEKTAETGADKKQIVLKAVDQFAKDTGVTYEIGKVEDAIEEVIKLTKNINFK